MASNIEKLGQANALAEKFGNAASNLIEAKIMQDEVTNIEKMKTIFHIIPTFAPTYYRIFRGKKKADERSVIKAIKINDLWAKVASRVIDEEKLVKCMAEQNPTDETIKLFKKHRAKTLTKLAKLARKQQGL